MGSVKTIAKEIQEDQEARERFLELAVRWIESRAKEYASHCYDGRDEASAKLSNELVDSYYIQEELEKEGEFTKIAKLTIYGNSKDGFGDGHNLRQMHKTLKQSFSSLVFQYLDLLETGSVQHTTMLETMRKKYGPDWHHCPFI